MKLNTRHIAALAAAITLVLTTRFILAAEDPCAADIQQFCKKIPASQAFRLEHCLARNEAKLSTACKARHDAAPSEQAQDVKLPQIPEECKADAAQFCKKIKPGEFPRLDRCLQRNEAKLSISCKAKRNEVSPEQKQDAKPELPQVPEACKADAEQYCKKIPAFQAFRLEHCLKHNEAKLSAPCKDYRAQQH